MTDSNKKKLFVFSSSLAGGGAEKHLLRILPILQQHYDVTLGLCRNSGELADDLPKNTKTALLGKGRTLKAIIPLVGYLKKHQPDLIFSIQDHANAIAIIARFLTFNKTTKLICSVQNNFSVSKSTTPLMRGKFLYCILPWLYRYADCLITCSNGLKANLLQILKQPIPRIEAIYNAAYEPQISEIKSEPCDDPWLIDQKTPIIISCGRLVPQKNFPLLLHAFKDLITSIDARLIIVGNGPTKENLENLTLSLRLIDKVKFVPFTLNHYKLMSRASIFVLPSLWEGFGNIIVEAMACEVPVIASDCPFGPNEIIENNKDGLLFENNNQRALTNAMLELLTNTALRKQLAQAAKEKCKQFASANIAAEHINLFNSL